MDKRQPKTLESEYARGLAGRLWTIKRRLPKPCLGSSNLSGATITSELTFSERVSSYP